MLQPDTGRLSLDACNFLNDCIRKVPGIVVLTHHDVRQGRVVPPLGESNPALMLSIQYPVRGDTIPPLPEGGWIGHSREKND
jgi:hypothetical protein